MSALKLFLCTTFILSVSLACDNGPFEKAEKTVKTTHMNNVEDPGIFDHIEALHYKNLNVTALKIKQQSFTELCKNSLIGKYDLIIIADSNLETIEPGSVYNENHTYLLSLPSNKLTEIKSGVFSGTNVRSLDLSHNSISKIDSTAFDNMPYLEVMNLSYNRLNQWDASWFHNCSYLHHLYFSHNLIEKLPKNAFIHFIGGNVIYWEYPRSELESGATALFSYIYLDNNLIKQIDPDAVSNSSIFSVLSIKSNKMKEISEDWIRHLGYIADLYLNDNDIKDVSTDLLEISKENVKEMHLDGNPLTEESKKQISEFKEKEQATNIHSSEESKEFVIS